MSWISMLEETYQHSLPLVGTLREGEDENSTPLLPVGHSTQNAHIEILLNGRAEVIDARVIENKSERVTIIPCTEGSIGRTGRNFVPHPLHDKLQYVARDYPAYGGDKPSRWEAYMEGIEAWCHSPYAHPKIAVVRDYVSKGTLIADMVARDLMLAEGGKLVEEASKEQKQAYPLLNAGVKQVDAFVRFRVHLKGDVEDKLWLDRSIWDSFAAYLASQESERGLCYVSGKAAALATNHPSKLRNTADKAKLISANDESGFTYLGRFTEKSQPVNVSYEVSQRAHNMLKWLLSRYGYRNDSQMFVAWGTKLQPIPGIAADTEEAIQQQEGAEGSDGEEAMMSSTPLRTVELREEYASRFRKAMAGYGKRVHDADHVVVLGVDSATTGRLSIVFYRELSGSDYLSRVQKWHQDCVWLHGYKSRKGDVKRFVGAPAPKEIALAAYGHSASEKLIKATVEQLMRCIVDVRPIPSGIRESLVRRASRPVAMEKWEWEKTLSIACAVVRKHQIDARGRVYSVAERETGANRDRSYLFGELLALTDDIEDYVQYVTENRHRETNAMRMMHAFVLRPAATWKILRERLESYLRQLDNHTIRSQWEQDVGEIVTRLGEESGFTNQPLDEQYLLGFYSKRMEIQEKRKAASDARKQKELGGKGNVGTQEQD